MRYAEGPTAEASVDIAAPPDAVWALVVDVDLPARFSDEFQGGRWLDDAPGVGARFAGRNRHPVVGEWETVCVVTEWEPGARFAWAVGDPEHPSASWGFELSPGGAGGTVLRQWGRIGPAPSGLTPAIEAMPDKEERIVERRMAEHRANMQRTIEGIKGLAER